MLAVLDETFPELPAGIAYVVGAVVLVEDETVARRVLAGVLPMLGRTRPFHWHREGPHARQRMIDCLEELGAVAHVCIHHPTGRKKQEAARARGLEVVVPLLLHDGASRLLIESRGHDLNVRDRGVILDLLNRLDRSGDLTYDWQPKTERTLWLADAVCGAVREHLLQTQHAHYYDQLVNGLPPV